MRWMATFVSFAVVLLATTARAEPAMTAGDLEQLCAGTDHVSRNACRIYILGVTQGIALGIGIAHGKSAGRRPCLPPGISAEALEQTLKRRLEPLAPAERNREAPGFIDAVLAAAFPCPGAAHTE